MVWIVGFPSSRSAAPEGQPQGGGDGEGGGSFYQ
jgi:hypothetical protein